jgi:16S rRNA (adenine1518-N6/adenine1519-N6)-dimethyltransferase
LIKWQEAGNIMNCGFTLTETIEIMREYGLKPSKGLGQNFLIDKNILRKMVDSAEINCCDQVLEIGPGIGTLTRELASRARKVVAVEIDQRLVPILHRVTAGMPNVTIINRDILEVDLARLWEENFGNQPVKVAANLPYYITTPIIMKLLEEGVPIKTIVVMVQKEVAERMIASPGGKDYGALSVAVQFHSRPRIVAMVPATVFIPRPRVGSAIVKMDIDQGKQYRVSDKGLLFSLVKAAFGHRRKTLLNAVGELGIAGDKDSLKMLLAGCGIDPARRGETLSIEEFCRLADCIKNW